MTQDRSMQVKADAKAAAAARKAEAEAAERREAEETRNRRLKQMEGARTGIAGLQEAIRDLRKKLRGRAALASHLKGFYEEIDKLAKGKTLLDVTDLVVEQANDIIRDAKVLVEGDPYLDRVKEFVPAGDNPVYPDVLLKARTVQQSLERNERLLSRSLDAARGRLLEAQTILVALECLFEDEEEGPYVSKEQVEERLDNEIEDEWFTESEDGTEYFDFDRLDEVDLQNYFSSYDEDEEEQNEQGEDEEA